MAVRSIGPNQIEFTETDDELLETVWVRGFVALMGTDGNSGDVEVYTNILDQTQLVEDEAGTFNGGPGLAWRSSGLNANETQESQGICGLMRGLRVTLPPGAVLLVNTE